MQTFHLREGRILGTRLWTFISYLVVYIKNEDFNNDDNMGHFKHGLIEWTYQDEWIEWRSFSVQTFRESVIADFWERCKQKIMNSAVNCPVCTKWGSLSEQRVRARYPTTVWWPPPGPWWTCRLAGPAYCLCLPPPLQCRLYLDHTSLLSEWHFLNLSDFWRLWRGFYFSQSNFTCWLLFQILPSVSLERFFGLSKICLSPSIWPNN